MVSCQDECWVRLFDKATGELFAECPIPQDRPLVTVGAGGGFFGCAAMRCMHRNIWCAC